MSEKKNVPEIRFEGFREPWENRKLSELATVKDSARIPNSRWSKTGIPYIRASDLSNNDLSGNLFLSEETYQYYKNQTGAPVCGDVLFNGGGEIGKAVFNHSEKPIYVQGGAVLYVQTSSSKLLDGEYLEAYFNTPSAIKNIEILSAGGTMKHFTLGPAQSLPICFPTKSEQSKIGNIITQLDTLLTLQQRKCERLKNIKKSMLEKMFPREGSDVPEIRFEGFSGAWERRKLSELVLIERGGSPRPIDDYITESPDGLNWVKIGDAPAQGRYITQTAEKIKPEGLAKTRQVQPGDLILSNSMSFGKPYIMGINGCIHDGWLLIRDTKEHFDMIFLCHMLGTPHMLNQYKMFAAGSTVNNLNKELVGNTTVSFPTYNEQKKIGEYLESLDRLITLHQQKYEKLKQLKQSLLEKMFV